MDGKTKNDEYELFRHVSSISNERYVTREEYERDLYMLKNKIDSIEDRVKSLNEMYIKQTDRLISIINENNRMIQTNISNMVDKIINSKNKNIEKQYRFTSEVIKYELAKGSLVGSIISIIIVLLKLVGFI